MKFLFLTLVFATSSAAFSCTNLLNSELKVLDSSEKTNMCEYEGNVILVVNVAYVISDNKPFSLFKIINNTRTIIGKRLLRDNLVKPIFNINELNYRYNLIKT